MIVCVCRRVSDTSIAELAYQGKGFDDIQFELGVATQCGRCENCAREVIEKCHASCGAAQSAWTAMSAPLRR